MHSTVVRPSLLSVFVLACASACSAAGWTDGLFPIKTHDFGTVAVAAKTEFVFPIKNTTDRDIHIASVRASCGCTTPILKEQWIKAGEEGTLVARFNTDTFWGKKGATLTVVIDRPAYAEVQLRVDGYIRRDMVFNPGSIEFGKVTAGESAERRVAIAYAGRSDWQITGVESPLPFVDTKIVEKSRSGQRVDYELVVSLSDNAPAGFVRDELIITTNDRSMPRVPVQIDADVEALLTVAPQTIDMGTMKPGEDKTQRLIVRGREPFKITNIEAPGYEVDFQGTDEPKAVHIVTVRLVAQAQAGPANANQTVKTNLTVTTDAGDELSATAVLIGSITDR